jgi:hypothetical protein
VAKREAQIRGVVESTAGLYGDLQGIAGRSLLEIEGLEIPLLDGPSASEAAERWLAITEMFGRHPAMARFRGSG